MNTTNIHRFAAFCVLAALAWWCCPAAQADEFEREPIQYSKKSGDNRVTRLMAELQDGKKSLAREADFGYLRAVLKELAVSQSSQTLVFSKTSLQRQRIAPATPRALYFSDDTYVGYCQGGDVLEIA